MNCSQIDKTSGQRHVQDALLLVYTCDKFVGNRDKAGFATGSPDHKQCVNCRRIDVGYLAESAAVGHDAESYQTIRTDAIFA